MPDGETTTTAPQMDSDQLRTALAAYMQQQGNQQSKSTETSTDTTTTDTDPGDDPAKLKAALEQWKALSRKNENQSKANAEKARRYDELLESQKSEAQKLHEAKAKAEKEAADAKLQVLKLTVANAKGVPAALLSGATQAELEASADALIEYAGKQQEVPDLGQGDRGGAAPQDPNAWIRSIAERTRIRQF